MSTHANLTAVNATHLLQCRHQIGRNGHDYEMRCHVLGQTKSGKVKILVIGERDWKDKNDIKKIRYVDSFRLREKKETK